MSYKYLLDIALILFSTKIFGIIAKKVQLPQVVGALIAGLLIGPAVFDLLETTRFISQVAELGVIVIMFAAGMETDVTNLKNAGKKGFIIALCGVLVPLFLGAGLSYFFNTGDLAIPGDRILQNFFIGVILTATSVSITVETLKELGKLNSPVGNTILAAALIDDILGLIALTLITSMATTDVVISPYVVLAKIIAFFIFATILGLLARKFLIKLDATVPDNLKDHQLFSIIALVLCLVMSFCAEHFFGVADITGSFIAGLVIGSLPQKEKITDHVEPLSFMLLTPIFFASIGISVVIPAMNAEIIIFAISLVVVALASKLIGCGIGAKLCGFNKKESVQIGVGMICRGEVALIVANKGIAMNLMPPAFFGPVIIMVIVAAIFTPILLKQVFKNEPVVQH